MDRIGTSCRLVRKTMSVMPCFFAWTHHECADSSASISKTNTVGTPPYAVTVLARWRYAISGGWKIIGERCRHMITSSAIINGNCGVYGVEMATCWRAKSSRVSQSRYSQTEVGTSWPCCIITAWAPVARHIANMHANSTYLTNLVVSTQSCMSYIFCDITPVMGQAATGI